MENKKYIKSFNEHKENLNISDVSDNINEGIFDMYTMNGIMDKISREDNDGQIATIIDKDHIKNIFGESYFIYFRFEDGYEDRMKVTSDKFSKLKVGDKITINY